MDYFKSLVHQSISRTREASLSMAGIIDEGLRSHVGKQMSGELGAPGCFLAPPVLEHTFGWKEAPITFCGLEGDLFSSSLLATLSQADDYQFDPSMNPYEHQLYAWRNLLDTQPKSAVITSGTGSGKTECFMIPILQDLINEQEILGKPLVGVRALFLYPLNALINSQQERLNAWTSRFGADIRFCLYNGKTEERESKVRRQQGMFPNQVLSRELLRREPPPILMTNATMLEYMLVRQQDNPILRISREQQSLRWIVLDEAHTYIGSQAAELSLLLRRVVQAFGRNSKDIRFVATSATIADTDAENRLKSFLADLAGIDQEQVVVIPGSRVIPDIPAAKSKSDSSLEQITAIEPGETVSPARFSALASSKIASEIRHQVVSSGIPKDLNQLLEKVRPLLATKTKEELQSELLNWLDIMTGTKHHQAEPPFLKLRFHLFQRMLHGLWSCVNPNCSAKSKDLEGWPFGNVYVTQRARCECHAPVYELAFCEDCKAPHLLGEEYSGVLQQRSPYSGDEFSLNHEASEDDDPESPSYIHGGPNLQKNKSVLGGFGLSHNDDYTPVNLDLDSLFLGNQVGDSLLQVKHANDGDASCWDCGHSHGDGKEFYRRTYLGGPFYVANAVPTVLEYCPDPSKQDLEGKSPEELPGRGRKLITFTDSRQGTARMAVRMQQEAERSRLRGLVFEVLTNAESRSGTDDGEDADGMSYEDLMASYEALKSIQPDIAQKLKNQAENLSSPKIVTVSWEDMLSELAASKDISQSILEYNRYANPDLFSGGEAGYSMARLLLMREYLRRPKYQNSTETLGIVKVDYKGLSKVKTAPNFWLDTKAKVASSTKEQSNLTLEDWKDFLKVTIDFYVRENTFVHIDKEMIRWIGTRFKPKKLHSPNSDVEESPIIKKWPKVKQSGQPNRLVKLLELVTGLDRTVAISRDKLNFWLESAWKDLVSSGVLESFESGYTLHPKSITFSLPKEAWVCPVTNRLFDTTFRGVTPYLSHNFNNGKVQCRKVSLPDFLALKPEGDSPNRLSRIRELILDNQEVHDLRKYNLWTDLSDRTVEGGFYYRTAEHSAQQSSDKLESYEDKFKKGEVNVLNCSTTMEMGVDIGGISAVVMNNVPPHPANYLQRAGRAGRRSEARAIAYTLCKSDPHNRRAFENPRWPFVTAIPAPSITLSSDRIVQRHVNSLLLGLFLKNEVPADGENTKLTVKWFFYGQDDSPYKRFISWLYSDLGKTEKKVIELVKGTGLSSRSITSIVDDCKYNLSELYEKWAHEYQNLNEKISHAKDDSYKKALSLELQRHEDEYLLKDLAARAFLPGYGFPTNVVNLSTYNIEDFKGKNKKKSDSSREDNIYSSKDLPTRGLDIAIREYAPGAQVVVDGRVHRSAGVGLFWHSGGAVKEAQKFDVAWRCLNCGATGYQENAYSNNEIECNHCNHLIVPEEKRIVLRPSGFLTDFYESTTNDISTQKFIRVARPRIQLDGDAIALPDSRCGFIRFGHKGSVFHHSSGEHDKGYAVCMDCGRAESMTLNGDLPLALMPDKFHRPVGGKIGSHKEVDCSGEHVKPNVYLGYESATDVLEVYLRNPKTDLWLSDSPDDQVIATTVAVALRDVIADHLGIASPEMGFGYRLDKDTYTGQGRSVIQLYDQVSGGAGFVIAGVGEIVSLLRKAADKLKCPDSCENVCSSCLAGQDSRVELEELNRVAALQWLNDSKLLSHLDLPTEYQAFPGATYYSYSPERFIRTELNKGADEIRILLRGDSKQWDLNNSAFRDKILAWLFVDKVRVVLHLIDPNYLSNEIQFSLASLAKLGVQISRVQATDTNIVDYLAIQTIRASEVSSLLTSASHVLIPCETWLHSELTNTWVTSNLIQAIDHANLNTSDWEKSVNATRLIEIHSELNGPLSDLHTRFSSLIESQMPELHEMLRSDAIQSLHYTDRYLKSPWSLMLLKEFLEVFCKESVPLKITALESGSSRFGRQINHDWQDSNDQLEVVKRWFGEKLGRIPVVELAKRPHDILHGRMLSVEWASGKVSKLMFDQGMGYWRAAMIRRADMSFDFRENIQDQLQAMSDKAARAQVNSSGVWPTFLTLVKD
ncbi:MAG: DEAD/DEAH box helicase [Pseudomonadales bacterium]|nr:DEAD/DEAH box helicase [Pseudomonadales bacterium]